MANRVVIGINDFKTYCLANRMQHLLDEWDYSKNDLSPEEYGLGSGKKVWWICPNCGNHYEATIGHRREGTSCPNCRYQKSQETKENNRKNNKNTLGDLYPELIREWCLEENGMLSPFDISPNCKKHIWWKCEKGHKWSALPSNRIKKRGCPYCAGKKVILGETDVATTHSELLDEWDYDKNVVLPTEISAGSNKKIHWKCKVGHQWSAIVGNRLQGSNCPYCGNKKIIVGENDLATTNPELVKEWNYEKNVLKPTEVVRGSGAMVWWKCAYGHEWKAKITNRIHGTNCPVCVEYMHTSFPEQTIFYYIKQAFPDAVNRDVSSGFELDIYIPSIKVGIEYDGHRYHNNLKKDIRKIDDCVENGIKLIKIREYGCPELIDNRCMVLSISSTHDSDIKRAIEEVFSLLNVDNIQIDINKDRQLIYENYLKDVKENSLAYKFPNIAEEWHPVKNGTLKSNMVFSGTNKRVWWMCPFGHEYDAPILARTRGSGCPYCVNKRIQPGYNDLATIHPEIISMWHPIRNTDVSLEKISVQTKRKFWWLGDCGHEWQDNPLAIVKNNEKCPYCGNRLVLRGFNDLKTINPDLVEEWDYEHNDFSPDEILAGSNKKAWWKCKKCGHRWQAFIQNRREGERKNTGCPVCADSKRKQTKINKRISEKSTLLDLNPQLVKEWHPTKNINLSPNMFAPNSHEKVWWLGQCGHEWEAVISSRYRGNGCPFCRGEKIAQKTRKRVLNVDTNEVFESVKEAAKKYKCTSGCITQCCSGKTNTAKGYHWKYIYSKEE